MLRGIIPCSILLIGEAPGETEDIRGFPFVGPAGRELDELLEQAQLYDDYAITNIVACWPNEALEGTRGVTRMPTRPEIKACSPRLKEFIEIASPKAVIALGQIAHRNFVNMGLGSIPYLELIHPSAILRQNSYSAAVSRKRFVVNLKTFLDKYDHILAR